MKRLICAVLTGCMLCSLVGCRESGLPQPEFPLTEEALAAALEETGLPGVISEDETQAFTEGHILYVLRHETETYENSGEKRMTAGISSAITEGERFLSMDFSSLPYDRGTPFAWEDWKQQAVFTALLYGGFADEEELYRVLSEQEMPEPVESPPTLSSKQGYQSYRWEAEFSAGYYCRAHCTVRGAGSEYDDLGNVVPKQMAMMKITIYESKALYEKQQQEALERQAELKRPQQKIA